MDRGEVAEIVSDQRLINSIDEALEILGELYYGNFDAAVLYDHNITPDFFDLKNKLAGDILQKFSNYRLRLAIVGQFDGYASRSMQDFIRESNRKGQILFVNSLEDALLKLEATRV